MSYKVVIQDAAAADARDYAAFLLQESKNSATAIRWLDELETAIKSLAQMPRRYKNIGEQNAFDIELHQVIHYSHRVVYHVDDNTLSVHILRIYHGARKQLSPEDIS